jgi:Uma2 family endonuclease
MTPPPGTATEADVLAVYARERRLCELVDGVLVEKPVGYRESRLASILGHFVETFLDTNNLGATAGEAGTLRLEAGLVRIPDLSFVVWEQFPNREWPAESMPDAYPDLAVEVLSASNTRREMERKRREYFAAGTRLVWEVNPAQRTVDVYTDPDNFVRLDESQSLDGGDVLPGFTLSIRRWFERAARGG